MSERITESNLKALVRRINEATGAAIEPYTKQADGRYKANIGNYHLDIAYGGYGGTECTRSCVASRQVRSASHE